MQIVSYHQHHQKVSLLKSLIEKRERKHYKFSHEISLKTRNEWLVSTVMFIMLGSLCVGINIAVHSLYTLMFDIKYKIQNEWMKWKSREEKKYPFELVEMENGNFFV